MGKICTVAIHKGGAGKTTVSAHLAFLAAERGSRTLLIDLDSQGNASDTVLLEAANLDGVRTAERHGYGPRDFRFSASADRGAASAQTGSSGSLRILRVEQGARALARPVVF